ncbi:ABC transporter ATP-binding protein [Enterococcus sp. HY326]|uniref:ABC transporter ATP-binding protein n=1 Tax=Enterococcus sp. HY326 TaxID=2971265 RepID=UPI00223ED599|nr:ATP-binding cassette domain-containing protein [Enterococcus sp. HY326]
MIQLEKVGFIAGGETILADISFAVTKGDFLTISGPSGGGKSTLLKIVASLLTATSGKILFEDRDLAELNPVTYRREVSYCFQQPALFGETVADNLRFPFEIRGETYDEGRAVELLSRVALGKSYLQKSINEISGGEKQRVALIRNLMFPPKVLLLDEVTTGLDEVSQQIVWQLISDSNQEGITILQVTHDRQEIAAAKQLLTIEGGKISELKRF